MNKYLNAKTYYDSRYDTFNRYRVFAGTSASRSSRFSLESNFMYQYDNHASVTNLIGFRLRSMFFGNT